MERMQKAVKLTISMLAAFILTAALLNTVQAHAVELRKTSNYRSYENGKYVIQPTQSGDIVLDKDGNELISPGKYIRIDYLGSDIFAVYKFLDNKRYRGFEEAHIPYLYNIATDTEYKVKLSDAKNDCTIYPFSAGYAKVKNAAFYAYTGMDYYSFVTKTGKLFLEQQPYSYCSDMIKVSDKLYFYTLGDQLSVSSGADKNATRTLTKRDKEGKALKSVVLPKGYNISVDLVKVEKTFYVRVVLTKSKETQYKLYGTNLGVTKKYTEEQIKSFETYNPASIEYHYLDNLKFLRTVDGKQILERDWVIITPFTTDATCFDAASWSTDENGWILLWDRQAEKSGKATQIYELDGPAANEAFLFEKVGTDSEGNSQYRIYVAHSGRQLKSYYDKDWNITVLAQGSFDSVDSKKNLIKEQIFTIIQNSDGSFYIKDYNGKYLTMSYGETKAGTNLVFADFQNGLSKQKYKAFFLDSGVYRDGSKRYGD